MSRNSEWTEQKHCAECGSVTRIHFTRHVQRNGSGEVFMDYTVASCDAGHEQPSDA